jgi:hypothetical protein
VPGGEIQILKNLLLISALCVAAAANSQTVFYGGDFDGRNGLISTNSAGLESYSYDDFTLGGNTTVTEVFANFLDASTGLGFASASWEIRSGVSTGNGGTLVASGSGAATSTATGRFGFNLTEFQVMVSGLNVNLGAGTYHLGVRVDDGIGYISTTSGQDLGPGGDPNPAVTGSPIANGNSFFNSAAFSANWIPTSDPGAFGPGTWDFSMGVNGVVPEPGTFVVLGTALAGLVSLRRRRS